MDWENHRLVVYAALLVGVCSASLPAQNSDRDSGSSLRYCAVGLEEQWSSRAEQSCRRALEALEKTPGAAQRDIGNTASEQRW
jgi:hypothetical protein